jgi:hypothetical protein
MPPSTSAPTSPPAHQKPDGEAGREVQREIEGPTSDDASQPGGELERAVLEPEREGEQDDPHLAQRRDQHIVERRRRERSEHDPGDEIERDRGEARARSEARTDCEHDRDRSELEEEPRSVPRRGEDHQLTASPSNRHHRSTGVCGRDLLDVRRL